MPPATSVKADGTNHKEVSVDLSPAPLAPAIEGPQTPSSPALSPQGSLEEIGQLLVKALRQASQTQALPARPSV